MEFFVPSAQSPTESERIYEAIRKFAEDNLKWPIAERRIAAISMKSDRGGRRITVRVGEPEPTSGEMVFAILESNAYLVCTPNRGVRSGMPILVGREDVAEVSEFVG